MCKRFKTLSLFLVCFMILDGVLINAAEPFIIEYDNSQGVYIDYEQAEIDSDFIIVSDLPDNMPYGFSFINNLTKMMVVESDPDGSRALRICEFSDLRIWSLNIESEDFYRVQATMKFTAVEGNEALLFCVTAAESGDNSLPNSTNSESTRGRLIEIAADENGKPILKNNANQIVTTLELGKAYTIGAVIKANTDQYDITVDDKVLSANNTFPSGVDSITSARLDIRGAKTDVLIDNIIIAPADVYTIGAISDTPTAEPSPTPGGTPDVTETERKTPGATIEKTDNEDKGTKAFYSILACSALVIGAAVVYVIYKRKKNK